MTTTMLKIIIIVITAPQKKMSWPAGEWKQEKKKILKKNRTRTDPSSLPRRIKNEYNREDYSLKSGRLDLAVIQQRELDSIVFSFQEYVVRWYLAVDDAAGVEVPRRLGHLSGDADGRSHPIP